MLEDLEVDVSAGQGVIRELIYELSSALDRGAGMAAAAISKELRDSLMIFTGGGEDHHDDATQRLVALLGAPLRHSTTS